MKKILLLLSLWFSIHATQKVYDCFLFFNELEVLDIRFHEMAPFVDHFVLVESNETFRGNPKPFYFKANIHLFEKFLDKVIYVPLTDRLVTDNPWEREVYQRDQIVRGLVDCKDEDIIMISDVDEIVEGVGIETIRSLFIKDPHRCVSVNQRLHSVFLNCAPTSYEWRGTVVTSFGELRINSPQMLRGIKNMLEPVAIGWHFSWMGGVEKSLLKLGAFSHSEYDTPEGRESIRKICLDTSQYSTIQIDHTYPKYIVENQPYFEQIGFILR